VLVAYATMYGSTREVAEVVASTVRSAGVDVDVREAGDVKDLGGYQAVVLGAPLITHKLHKDARRFLSRNEKMLEGLPVALFALGPCKEPHDDAECGGTAAGSSTQRLRIWRGCGLSPRNCSAAGSTRLF